MAENGVDLISNLPRNILDIILTRMPIKDAVRTSILARKWRYAWASIPVLQFDHASLPATFWYNADKLTRIVDHVLLLHNGPIQKFKVGSCCLCCRFHVDKWVLFLSRQGVNHLSLEFKKAKDPYIVPSCLFSCKQLKELALCGCVLRTPLQFDGFCRLKALELVDTRFTKETIESLISSCPLLEELGLCFDYKLEHIKLHAPKLKIFYLWGVFDDISLVSAACLVHADIVLHKQSDLVDAARRKIRQTNNLDKFLGSLVNLAKLNIGMYFMQYLALDNIPKVLPNSLVHLKSLAFHLNYLDSKEVLLALCLFKSSPNLEEVKIYADSDRERAVLYEERFWEEHKTHGCTFNHLKVVEICEVCCIHEQKRLAELITYVFCVNEPILRNLKLTPKVTVAAKMQTYKSLLQFP